MYNGKHVFISGGTSGICFAMAQAFVREGAKVTILGRKPDKAAKAQADLGPSAFAVLADVRDPAALTAALTSAVEKHGPIHVLVNGAAGNFPAPALGMSPNGFKAVVDIDLLGTFNVCRLAFDHLAKPGAVVLNVSAGQAFTPALLQVHVCAAKAGVDMVTRVLAMEWGPLGVRVNSISPGPVDDTEGMLRLAPTPEIKARVIQDIPLRRFATKDEIADIALFLCGPKAAYITGAVIVADGGHALAGFGNIGGNLV